MTFDLTRWIAAAQWFFLSSYLRILEDCSRPSSSREVYICCIRAPQHLGGSDRSPGTTEKQHHSLEEAAAESNMAKIRGEGSKTAHIPN